MVQLLIFCTSWLQSYLFSTFLPYYFQIISPDIFCYLFCFFLAFFCPFYLFFPPSALVRRSGVIAALAAPNTALWSDALAKCSRFPPSQPGLQLLFEQAADAFSPVSVHKHVNWALEGLVSARKIQFQFTEVRNG